MHRLFDICVIFRTDMERGQGVDSAGKSDEESGEKRDKDACRSHGAECNRTHKFPDNGDVGKVEDNL